MPIPAAAAVRALHCTPAAHIYTHTMPNKAATQMKDQPSLIARPRAKHLSIWKMWIAPSEEGRCAEATLAGLSN